MAEAATRLGAIPAQTEIFRGVEHNDCEDAPVVTEEAPRLEVSEYQDCGVETVVLEAGPHR